MFFKPRVEKIEEEFKTGKLKNKYLYHDLSIRSGDPEEVRVFSSEIMQELGFFPILNKFTKFEDLEMEDIFRSGRLKPVKSILKGVKKIKKGPKYGLLWKLLAVLGFFSLIFYFYLLPGGGANLQLVSLSIGFMLFSLLVYLVKRTLIMEIWLKISGIYDVESEKSDLKLILAADVQEKTRDGFRIIEEDVNEMYNELGNKYVKHREGKEAKALLVPKKGVSAEEKIASSLKSIDDEISSLDTRLSKAEITEETYRQVLERLNKKRDKIETILDLFSAAK
jgi:hypothetical protein